MTTIGEAEALAKSKLAVPLPRRWRHVQSVAWQASLVAERLSLSENLVVAAWLHDIGYAPELVDTGLHPLDGARYLRSIGVAEGVVRLVAYHSNAVYEARVRGLEQDLLAEFEPEESITYDALVFCDLTTGPDGGTMSFGELFGIALEDFDFDGKTVRLRRQIKKLGEGYVFALPKNDRERIIPLSDWAIRAIKRHVEKYPPQSCTLPWEKPTGRRHTCNILFRWHTDGQHLKARNYSETVWKPALVKAGIIPAPTRDRRGRSRYVTTRKEGVHQLRHYYASVMLAGGVSVKELAEYLGHSDPAFTLRVYAHMLPSSHDRARVVINDHFAALMLTEQ